MVKPKYFGHLMIQIGLKQSDKSFDRVLPSSSIYHSWNIYTLNGDTELELYASVITYFVLRIYAHMDLYWLYVYINGFMWEIDKEYFVDPHFTSADTAYQQASGEVHLYIMMMSNPG